jgi:AcrR family transcriptional regulator
MKTLVQDKPYHHGDLRRALLDAALQLVEERGLEGFTLREVARQAGVSHNAPYTHFADRAALVEALAVESFNMLTQTLRDVASAAADSPLDALLVTGRAYVDFALTHSAMFRLMFRPELRQTTVATQSNEQQFVSALDTASLAAYQVLVDCIRACQEAQIVRPGDSNLLALTAWATIHGLAMLLLDGAPGGIMTADLSAQAITSMVETVTTTLTIGLITR